MLGIVLVSGTLFLFALAAFKNPFLDKLLFCSILYSLDIFLENICLAAYQWMAIDTTNILPDSIELFYTSALSLPARLILYFYFVYLWRKYWHKDKIKMTFLFFIPLVQILLYEGILLPWLLKNRTNHTLPLIISMIIPLFCIPLFIILLRRQERLDIHDEYLELTQLHEMEQLRCNEMESHWDELAKLRHDYNNQLFTIQSLLVSEKYADALKFADSLREVIQKAKKENT